MDGYIFFVLVAFYRASLLLLTYLTLFFKLLEKGKMNRKFWQICKFTLYVLKNTGTCFIHESSLLHIFNKIPPSGSDSHRYMAEILPIRRKTQSIRIGHPSLRWLIFLLILFYPHFSNPVRFVGYFLPDEPYTTVHIEYNCYKQHISC